jgi:hypothetical protein
MSQQSWRSILEVLSASPGPEHMSGRVLHQSWQCGLRMGGCCMRHTSQLTVDKAVGKESSKATASGEERKSQPQPTSALNLAVMANEPKEPARALSSVDDGPPAVVFTQDHFLVSPTLDEEFLKDDLSVKRIEDIAPHLWMVGRPSTPVEPTANSQTRNRFVATTDASLHLVWTYQTLYVKALPRYLVSMAFFEPAPHSARPMRPGTRSTLHLHGPCAKRAGLCTCSRSSLAPDELQVGGVEEAHSPNLGQTSQRDDLRLYAQAILLRRAATESSGLDLSLEFAPRLFAAQRVPSGTPTPSQRS